MEKQEIEKLKDGEVYQYAGPMESGAEVWFKHGIYFLFIIPMFGDQPVFHRQYAWMHVDHMINEFNGLT